MKKVIMIKLTIYQLILPLALSLNFAMTVCFKTITVKYFSNLQKFSSTFNILYIFLICYSIPKADIFFLIKSDKNRAPLYSST